MISPTLLGIIAINRGSTPEPPVPTGPTLPSDYWHVSNDKYSAAYFVPQISAGVAASSFSVSTGTLYAVPFFVGRSGRIVTQLGAAWSVAPTAGAVIKLGIYSVLPPASHNVYPQQLLASLEISLTATTGIKTGTLPVPLTLNNGLYWMAFARKSGTTGSIRAVSGTAQTRGFNQAAGRNPLQWTDPGNIINGYLQATLADADPLPSSFISASASSGNVIPQLMVL